MPARRTARDRIIDAALKLAAERPWAEVSLADIASGAGLTLADMRREVPGRNAIICAFLDRIDAGMLAADDLTTEETARDRIFDILMRRFDQLGPHKAAIRSIVAGLAREPGAALAMAARLMRTQRWVLEGAGATSPGLRGRLKVKGLAAVYMRAFRVWLDEDDPGMPRTMAVLDRSLRSGERWIGRARVPVELADAALSALASLAAGAARRRASGAERSGDA